MFAATTLENQITVLSETRLQATRDSVSRAVAEAQEMPQVAAATDPRMVEAISAVFSTAWTTGVGPAAGELMDLEWFAVDAALQS